MVVMDEAQALENVRQRLVERFPDVHPDVVRTTVADVHRQFDGRVRSYVPILVERAARARLGQLSATSVR
jgi:hypothetical protein